jgi:hypothetical protein
VSQCGDGGGGGGAELEDTPHDSAESSVEGIFLSGVRSLHPFKMRQCEGGGQSLRTRPMIAQRAAWREFSGVRFLHSFKVWQCGGGAEPEHRPYNNA